MKERKGEEQRVLERAFKTNTSEIQKTTQTSEKSLWQIRDSEMYRKSDAYDLQLLN